jgi:hypothetical protein
VFRSSVPASEKIHFISVTKANWLILFREVIAVSFRNHAEDRNAELLNVKAVYSNHCALKG